VEGLNSRCFRHDIRGLGGKAEGFLCMFTLPERLLVRQSNLDELLLVSRDKEGYSIITRPGENEQVRIFLENELGLDDLLVQNLLGA